MCGFESHPLCHTTETRAADACTLTGQLGAGDVNGELGLDGLRVKHLGLESAFASTLSLAITPRPDGRERSGQALTASPQKTHRQPVRSYSKEA